MAVSLLGVGIAVPEQRVPQELAARVVAAMSGATGDQLERILELYRHTQIDARHKVRGCPILNEWLCYCAGEQDTPPSPAPALGTAERMAVYERESLPLGLVAARAALKSSRLNPSQITHLVTVSCTGFSAPGFDIGLIQTLNMVPTVERTHIGFMGCHGAFNALRVATALASQDREARVLVCSVELCSLHQQPNERLEQFLSNALFADGAGALVVGDTGENHWKPVAHGSCLFPDSAHAMTWTIGNHGFAMTLSKDVPRMISTSLRTWFESWLAANQLSISNVASWAIHPGGPRILVCVEEALCLPHGTASVSREVLRQFGNMSSATLIFLLDQLIRSNAPLPCVAIGFGPGLTAEVVLFR